jgi:hypothetical protein
MTWARHTQTLSHPGRGPVGLNRFGSEHGTRGAERVSTLEWTRGDLNPRPLLCESSDLPLIYVPAEAGIGKLP